MNLVKLQNTKLIYEYLLHFYSLTTNLDSKVIKPVNAKGNQPWIFIGRTDAKAEAEALLLWPPDAKNWLIGKEPDAGKDWRWEEKGTTVNEMVGWHPWLRGHEFEQSLENGKEQGSVACCSPQGHKELDTTGWLHNNNNNNNNKLSERENKKTILSKRTKYLGINLTKDMKDLYLENLRYWWKKLKMIQTDGNIYYVHELEELMLLIWSYHPKQYTDSVHLLSKYQGFFFTELDQIISKICMKTQKTQ